MARKSTQTRRTWWNETYESRWAQKEQQSIFTTKQEKTNCNRVTQKKKNRVTTSMKEETIVKQIPHFHTNQAAEKIRCSDEPDYVQDKQRKIVAKIRAAGK